MRLLDAGRAATRVLKSADMDIVLIMVEDGKV